MVKRTSWIVALLVMIGASAWAADAVDPLDRVLGKESAPLTLIEYASMTCPHCAHFHETVIPSIKAEWIDTGKAKLIYRDFPTAPVGMAVGVAMITQCAPKDQYFPILGLLFKTQERWMGSQDPLTEIKRTVGLAGLTPSEVDACLKRTELGEAIEARSNQGQAKFGIQSTPTLLVDGKKLEGAQSYADIKKDLEAAYAKVAKK